MIHPHTELRHINAHVGYGVFATQRIPAGTITYVKDTLEKVVTPTEYLVHNPAVRTEIDKYSYIDDEGNRIVSWDFAKYVNHSCRPNSMSTGYGFEIALVDILPGEQLTDEYGIFNLDADMDCACGEQGCRGRIKSTDFETYRESWDQHIRPAFARLFDVEQPLMGFVDEKTRAKLDGYFSDFEAYISVYALRFKVGV